MNLQTILLPDGDICSVTELYFHRTDSTVDLDGYFNLFYIEKHRKYTQIQDLSLRVSLRGFSKAVVMHDRDEVREIITDAGVLKEYVIDLPYQDYDKGVFWLRLYADPGIAEEERRISGYYDTAADDGGIKIAIVICTYKREHYVIRNLGRLNALFEKDKKLADRYHIILVDNGRTLREHDGFCAGGMTLIDNPNTGGTGGFARGMREAMALKEELGITHLLLMDDDAVFDPDLFVRLYGLLSVLKLRYEDIIIGGAMWREDMPYIQHAAGEIYRRFEPQQTEHPVLDLRCFDDCVSGYMTKPFVSENGYCGWWCCCSSMDLINEDTLPLPLFMHGDDIQFSLRNGEHGLLFMNGIGVWHRDFSRSFQGVKKYYSTRNSLITSAIYEEKLGGRDAAGWVIRQISGTFLSFRYAEMRLVCRGAEDFLRGPGWLFDVDREGLHRELTEYYRDHAPMKPLPELLGDRYPAFERRFLSDAAGERLKKGSVSRWSRKGSFLQYITLNGWLLPPKKKIVPYCNAGSQWSLFRAGRVLLYEPGSCRGYFSNRRWSEMFTAFVMIFRLTVLFLLKYPSVSGKWREYRVLNKRDSTGFDRSL